MPIVGVLIVDYGACGVATVACSSIVDPRLVPGDALELLRARRWRLVQQHIRAVLLVWYRLAVSLRLRSIESVRRVQVAIRIVLITSRHDVRLVDGK